MNRSRNLFEETDYVCFSTDLDWAPDIAIRQTLDFFAAYEIRPTVFVTHFSEEIVKRDRNIDLGIHPNFIQPSSQGDDLLSVIDYCSKLVPDAKCFRCHRWYSSNDIYDELLKRGFLYESNICTDMEIVSPFIHRSGIISFPVFFEDGAFIQYGKEMKYQHWKENFRKKGLKIFNIHPMHLALNTPYFRYTRDIKDKLSRTEWNQMHEDVLNEFKYNGMGIRNMIEEIVNDAIDRNAKIITLKDAFECFGNNT